MKTPDFEVSSGNVFKDLGFENPEEEFLKSRLASAIEDTIKARGLTQKEAGILIGLKQPKVCDIISGRLGGYSVERLMRFPAEILFVDFKGRSDTSVGARNRGGFQITTAPLDVQPPERTDDAWVAIHPVSRGRDERHGPLDT